MEGVNSTTFVQYISGKVDNSLMAWQRAYESLLLHPTQLSCLTAVASERERFINRFDRYAERLIHFFKRIPQTSSSSSIRESGSAIEKQRSIAAIITGHLLSDLLLPGFRQLWGKDSLCELAIYALSFAHAEHLRHIADQLIMCPTLLAMIISSEQSRQLLRPWIRILSTQEPNTAILEAWTAIIADCCSTCPNHQGLEAILAQWAKAQLVRRSLKGAGFKFTSQSPGNQAQLMAPPVTHEVQEAINELMPKPKKKPVPRPITVTTLQYIELEVTASILSKLCDLMPCRRCFALARSGNLSATPDRSVAHSTIESWVTQDTKSKEQGLEDVLFNQGIGLWKVVLSGQALKDLQSSKTNGLFHRVWAKLQDLSTGDWIRKSVAQPFDMPTECLNPKVRLFIACCCTDDAGKILWQVDYGYDSRVRSHSQIVKVWRIGTSEEIEDAAVVVARTQRQWSDPHVAMCKKKELDRDLGIKVPAVFAQDLPQNEAGDGQDPAEAEELTSLNLLISNKFHALTNRIFDNILYGEQFATFPYDPKAKEVTIIKHFETATFILGRSGTGKTTCLLYKLLSRYIASRTDATENKEHCQILVTRSKELAKKLQAELEELIKAQLVNTIHTRTLAPPETNDKEKWDGSLEETDRTLFQLSQYRSPLVCTFAHFLRLVENSIMENDRKNYALPVRNTVADFVDFQFFRSVYWPKLTYQGSLGVHLDAGMVFSEIMGVIKGSASTRNGLKPLSREAYITRSPNLAPVFPTPDARGLLFYLYSQYESRKVQRGDEDAIDRIIKILNGIKRFGLEERLKNIVQEIYVDEVQDQCPLELELILHLIRSPRGVHFAGDSAQCISNDSAFRFANVKALFFDHYAKTEYELSKPTLFALSHNFRSRQGILAFSSFIMSLLWKGFPTMVDKLDPEIGENPGPKPVIFVGAAATDLLMEASSLAYVGSNNSTESEGSIKQVVVVRDEDARFYLQTLLGNKRMVYTILETKGMEYDDVFILDFFQSSPCSKTMHTLQELLPDNVNETYAEKNMLMCSELKNLYVAVTRARNRLWLLESSTTSVIDLLTGLSRPLVDIRYIDPDPQTLSEVADTLRPISGTTVEDWGRAGIQNMENKLYDRALQCFQNAGDLGNADLAQAHIYEKTGREQRANCIQGFRKLFIEAAKLFQKLNRFTQCLQCLEAAGEFATAARILSDQGDHQRAAGLFARAGTKYVEDAASEYYAANLPEEGLHHLFDNEHYESVINGLASHMDKINDSSRKKFATGCNQHVRQPGVKLSDNMKEKAFKLFRTDEEKEKYLDTHGHDTELIQFCASSGEFPSVIWCVVCKGNLEVILKESLLTPDDRPWPSNRDEFLDEVYQVWKTQILFKALNAGREVPESVFTAEEEFRTMPWATNWHKRISTCRDILEKAAFPSRRSLDKSTREFVSVLMLAKADYFTAKATNLSQLHSMLESLQYYAGFLRPLELEPDGLPKFSESTICWALGLIKEPWGPNIIYHCPPWSFLFEKQNIYTADEMPRILVQARKSLASLVPVAADKILAKGAGTPTLKIPDPCQKCVSQDWLPSNVITTCDDHEVLNKEVCQTQCQERLRWWEMRVGFRGMCFSYNLLLPGAHSVLATQKDLSSQLQNLFSYKSAFVQDAAAISHTRNKILNERRYRPLLRQSQSLTIKYLSLEINRLQEKGPEEGCFRLKNSWKQSHLSNLIKGYRLLWTFSSLTTTYPQQDSILSIEDQLYATQISLVYAIPVIRCYDEFKRLAQSQLTFLNTISIIRRLQEALDQFTESKKCSSYDAEILSIYEEIATLLLFLGWPDEVIIPNSWRELHLSHWTNVLICSSPYERRACQYLLYQVASNFCRMITSLESQVNKGLDPILQDLLTRRSVDFILIILLNFRNLLPSHSHYWVLYPKIQELLSTPALRAKRLAFGHSRDLLGSIAQAFKVYTGKDYLCLNVWGAQKGNDNEEKENFLPYRVHSRPTCAQREQSIAGCGSMEIAGICFRAAIESKKSRRLATASGSYLPKISKEQRAQLEEVARILIERFKSVQERRKRLDSDMDNEKNKISESDNGS